MEVYLSIYNYISGTANSDIRYSIVRGDAAQENFTIDPHQGLLRVKSPIDFEKLSAKQSIMGVASMKAISLLVEARDRGVPSLASEVPVIIYVEDVNDHAPRFEQTFYQASIPEDLQPGSTILQVNPLAFNVLINILLRAKVYMAPTWRK